MDDLLLGPLGAERGHPAQALIPPKTPAVRRRLLLALVAAVAVGVLPGCGGDEETSGAEAGLTMPGGGGTLVIAVPEIPAVIDPLAATSSSEQLAVRQVNEPLIGRLSGPYGDGKASPGLALSAKPSPDRTVWTLELRPGVRFQDGTPFNASAVLANGQRWLTSKIGRGELPDLFAVDAPRPNEVRFQLTAPDPQLPDRLSSPRLGIVSPQAMEPRSGVGARVRTAEGTGTGPFELRARTDDQLDLARYASWWGSPLGLGPALERVAFVRAPSEQGRLDLLLRGEVEAASELGAAALRDVEAEPLLAVVSAGGAGFGVEASVRDLTGGVQSLSGVWLTRVGG